jgi:hypothetical protein
MENSQLLTTLLVSIGYRLPILIALGVGLVMLLDTPRGRVRTVAMSALAVLLAATFFGGLLSVLPLLLIAGGNFAGLSGLNTVLSVAHFGLSLLEATGFILLAWALVQALRRQSAPGTV